MSGAEQGRFPPLDDAWLVAIDPQRIFADPESDWGSPMFGDIVAPVHRLQEDFGPDRTLVTRWLPGERTGSWRAYFDRWPFAHRHVDDPMFSLVEQAGDLSDHPTIDATTFGKWGQDLTEVTGPTPTLVLTGVATDCCVISTALPAADAGSTVVIAADGCAGSSVENHESALRVMSLYAPQIVVTVSAAVLDERRARTPRG